MISLATTRQACAPRVARGQRNTGIGGNPLVVRRRSTALNAVAPSSSTPSSSSSAEKTGRPVVVFAIDDTEAAAQALEWAATTLCGCGDNDSSTSTSDLRLLHVVCDARAAATSIGVTPTGRVRRDAAELADRRSPAVREHEARLVAAARDMIDRRCRAAGVALPPGGVAASGESGLGSRPASPSSAASSTSTPSPPRPTRITATDLMLPVAPGAKSAAMIGAAVCRAARSAGPGAALVVPSHGPGALADFGSVARFCYQRALAASSATGGSTRAGGDCSALVLVPPASALEAARSRRVALAARSARELDALAAWSAANVLKGDGTEEVVVISVLAAGSGGGASSSSSFELSPAARQALQAAKVAAVVDGGAVVAGSTTPQQQQLWQQAVLDAAQGARCVVMLEDEHKASTGEAETFEEKMAALMGGGLGGSMTLDEGAMGIGGGGNEGDAAAAALLGAEQAATGLADYASRRASVPLVLLKRR
jgi:hypothetical protein